MYILKALSELQECKKYHLSDIFSYRQPKRLCFVLMNSVRIYFIYVFFILN